MMPQARNNLARFEEKYMPEPNSGCWLWLGADNGLGYGKFWLVDRLVYAHRAAYEFYRGPIPEGLSLDHLCHTPSCVNPDHPEPVTHAENVRRGPGNGFKNKTHCPAGHPYSPENTYHIADGRRDCRECTRRRGREYRARQKEKLNAQT